MAILYKPDGSPVEVPDEEVAARYLSGELGFDPDKPVPISNGARVGTLPSTSPNLKKALESGWKFDPLALETRQHGGAGEQAKAFGEGVSSIVPGAPLVEEALLQNLPEQQRRARVFPKTKLAGEAVGMTAAALAVPELAAPRAAGLARVVVGGALEAGVQGGVLELNRQILGEESISAEKLASSAGLSAGFGGVASGALHAAGAIASGVMGKGTRAFKPAAAAGPRRGVDDAIEAFNLAAEKDPVGAERAFAGVFGKDKVASAKRLLADKDYRGLAKTALSDVERANIEIADGLESMRTDMDKALSDVVAKFRGEIDPALAIQNPTMARQATFDLAESIRDRIRYMREGNLKGAGGAGEFFGVKQITDLEKQLQRLDEAAGVIEVPTGATMPHPAGATMIGPNGVQPVMVPLMKRALDPQAVVKASTLWKTLDDTRDALWDIAKVNHLMGETEKAAAEEAGTFARFVRDMLEGKTAQFPNGGDPTLFGKAAAAQARKNSLLTRARAASDELGKKFGAGVDSEIVSGDKYLRVAAEKMRGFFGDLSGEAWEPHRRTLAEVLTTWREIGDELINDTGLQQKLAGAYGKTAAMAKLGRAMADMRRLRGIASQGEAVLGHVVGRAALSGMMFGPIIGGPAAVAVGTAAPYVGSAVIALLDSLQRASSGRILGYAATIAKGTRPGRRATVDALSILASAQFSDQPRAKKPKDAREAYARTAADLRAAVKDPAGTLATMRANAAPIALESPSHAEAIVQHGWSKLQYAASKLPPELPRDPLTTLFHVVPPSDSDIADFAQIARAVDDPVGIMEDLAHGSMSLVAARTLRETSPVLFEEMKAAIVNSIQESGKPVPYQTRLRLSMFFGQPLDPTLDASFIGYAQATYAPPPQPPGAPQGTGRSTKELKSVKEAATAMQDMEAADSIST